MTTFAEDEASIADSQPREIYEFTLPGAIPIVHRLASGSRDIVVDGQTYRATTIAREDVEVKPIIGGESGLEIPILVSHPLAQRYLRDGIPPRRVDVIVRRKQLTSGQAEGIFIGRVQSMAIDGHVAKFLVQSRTHNRLQTTIPTVVLGRLCPHVLYDAGTCRANEAAFQISCTVFSVNGAEVLCSSDASFAVEDWYRFGKLIHVASAELADISKQVSNLVTLSRRMPDMQVGDVILLSAGCSHQIHTCLTKFHNVPNYGGIPHKPSGNPWLSRKGIFDLKQFGLD